MFARGYYWKMGVWIETPICFPVPNAHAHTRIVFIVGGCVLVGWKRFDYPVSNLFRAMTFCNYESVLEFISLTSVLFAEIFLENTFPMTTVIYALQCITR